MKENKVPVMRLWNRALTVKDLVFAALSISVLTTIIIFTVAALGSQGQQELARRVDINAQVTRLLVSQHKEEETCILSVPPDERTIADTRWCIREADKKYGETIDTLFQELRGEGEPVPGIEIVDEPPILPHPKASSYPEKN